MLEKGGLEPDRVAMGTQPPKPFEGGDALNPRDIFSVVTGQLKGVFAEPEGERVEPEDGERNPDPGNLTQPSLSDM